MKLRIEIDVEASETIVDTIKRGSFAVNNDGSGHKLKIGDNVTVPNRKCKVKFTNIPRDSTTNGNTTSKKSV